MYCTAVMNLTVQPLSLYIGSLKASRYATKPFRHFANSFKTISCLCRGWYVMVYHSIKPGLVTFFNSTCTANQTQQLKVVLLYNTISLLTVKWYKIQYPSIIYPYYRHVDYYILSQTTCRTAGDGGGQGSNSWTSWWHSVMLTTWPNNRPHNQAPMTNSPVINHLSPLNIANLKRFAWSWQVPGSKCKIHYWLKTKYSVN